MSLDRSLKQSGGLVRSRGVLTRAERIARLLDEGKFDKDSASPYKLPKVRVYHSKAGTKTKKAVEGVEGEAGAAGAPAAGAAAPAAGAKAAPGAGAKAGAPAAKAGAPAAKAAAPAKGKK
jgi:small basic protein (TIGR04137 family)